MERVLVFGAGKMAEAVTACAAGRGAVEICGYTADADYVNAEQYLGRPLMPFDRLPGGFAPENCVILVAVGYQDGNRLRAARLAEAKERGYRVISLVGAAAVVPPDFACGENTVVFDGAVVQPGATIGADVFLWGGASIGHHSTVGDHCWVAGGACLGGAVELGANTFVGMGAVVGHEVRIGRDCILGAGTLTTKSLPDESVVVRTDSEVHRLNSRQFLRLTRAL